MDEAFKLPEGSWNCHVHCFDPLDTPLKQSRAYTPQPAPVTELFKHVCADNVVIVQASIEDGYEGLMRTLEKCHQLMPERKFRGIVCADFESAYDLQALPDTTITRMHKLGICSVRIHGSYGGQGRQIDWVRKQFLQAARLAVVREYGWKISAQLPFRIWSKMANIFLNDSAFRDVSIIADHNLSASPSDAHTTEWQDLLLLLKSGKLFVKLGAFHRRHPYDISQMEDIVKSLVQAAPKQVLWGSDWPHVDASRGGLIPTDPLSNVDTESELKLLRSWVTDEQWSDLLIGTPQKLFT